MATVRPFKCIRPKEELAERIAALPYDVYNSTEAKEETIREPLSFLKIDRAETQFETMIDPYSTQVYEKAREILEGMIKKGDFITDSEDCYYIYELIMNGRSQTGLVACTSIDDYLSGVIKKHENTREDKEIDRINHVDVCSAQTGPIFLAYRSRQEINNVLSCVKKSPSLYDFVSVDGIIHKVWKISDKDMTTRIEKAFEAIGSIYIADGHHRTASAVKVGIKRRNENSGYSGKEEFNFFLSVLFGHDQLMIMPYNRAVTDLNGLSQEQFIRKVKENFQVSLIGEKPYFPEEKASFGMYINGKWYELKAKTSIVSNDDPVLSLDVSILQNYLLKPILGIKDPRTDKRIDFIGGIRGLDELARRVEDDMVVAFSMYPTSINELFEVSDAGRLMPPKSTWFEPKLRSGLFIHKI